MSEDIKLNLEVMYDFLIVKRDKPEDVSEGGILIPDVSKIRAFKGTILGVGPGTVSQSGELIPVPFKVGQRIMFHPNSAILVDHKLSKDAKEEEIVVLKAYDTYAVITEEY